MRGQLIEGEAVKDGIVVRSVRRSVSVGCTLALALGWMGSTAPSASAVVFSNTAAIDVPDGQASPYPSTISVPAPGRIFDVNVSLVGLSHTFPDDVDVLLVGPTGLTTVLMADAGGTLDLANVNLSFDDGATGSLPDNAQISAGTYKPSNLGTFSGTAPAPAAPYGATLSVFKGSDPAGTWKLFVFDDAPLLVGSMSGGWSLDITYSPEFRSFSPSLGEVGDTVTITGIGLTGASTVKFGAIPATAFTVDSDTQITATVPAGASTGPMVLTVQLPSAQSATITTLTDFVVHHERNVSLALSGKKAIGTVSVEDGFTACGSKIPVNVQHLKNGKWRTVAGVLTKTDGSYKAGGLDEPGKYRTVAKKTTLPSGDVCLKDISPIDKK
jgi:subtilisin-like proprotein convertase family protein